MEIISKELIKPSSPTPVHLRHHQLSFLDQISVPVFMPLFLFYSKQSNTTSHEMCNHIKKSLSKALTHFYPLAGRVKDNEYIDCNDEGVPFVEAEANCTLSDILQSPNPGDLNKFLPCDLDDVKDLVAVFQFTYFKCGGVAIGLGMSHKVGDALSFFMFLNAWANVSRTKVDGSVMTVPRFASATIFPPKDISGFHPATGIAKEKIVAKRFVFYASSIATLRAKYAENPTRVEALSAFIWSRFIAATQANKLDPSKIYTVLHAVNLRPRIEPPLLEQYFGNISRIAVSMPKMDAEDNCFGILRQMREAIKNVNVEYIKKLQESEGHLNFIKDRAERFMKGEVVSFSFTSLCRFPINEADFGWGKPVFVGSCRLTFKNLVTFLDTREGDGVEAWINLEEEDMVKFEMDKEILAYASPSPSVEISGFGA